MTTTGVKACPRCTGFVAHVDDEYFCLSCGYRVGYDTLSEKAGEARLRLGRGLRKALSLGEGGDG